MALIKWTPMKELDNIRRDMERLFDEFMEPFPRRRHRWMPRTYESSTFAPNIEMYDRKTALVVRAELPGVDKNDIDLTITQDTLTIKGEFKKSEEIKDENCYLAEMTYGSFSRTITLPSEVDSEKAMATCKNGVLEVTLPKIEAARPKEIKVDVS